MASNSFSQIMHNLLDLVPQYVIGCLPALAIVGESPMDKKLLWLLRCIGCPFTGLFYSINVGGKKETRCLYWLPSVYFTINNRNGSTLAKCRPFGFHNSTLNDDQRRDIRIYVERCTAKASVLERLSSIVSAYYIVVGIIAGISMATGPIFCENWPFIPLLLSWTIPAVCRRVVSGNLVVKDPNDEFQDPNTGNKVQINMDKNRSDRIHKRSTVILTAFVSIFYPWLTVLLAYYTPPKGYLCRSKYITVICSIWSFNSSLAFLCHLKGESDLLNFGYGFFHIWFVFWGFIVTALLFTLAVLTKNYKLWVTLFGNSCDVSSIGC